MKAGRLILAAAGLLAAVSAPLAGVESFTIRVELSIGSTGVITPVVAIMPWGNANYVERPGDEGGQSIERLTTELADLYKLREFYSLAESTHYWDGTGGTLPSLFRLESEVFRLDLDPQFLAPNRMKLRILVSRIKNKAGDLERLLDSELVATIDDPIVAGFTYRGQPLFLTLEVSKAQPHEALERTGAGVKSSRDLAVARKPVRRVDPKIPEGVDLDSLKGEVVLRVSVGDDGRVTGVEILRSLQPEVDRETVKALKEWTFDPVRERAGQGSTTFIMTFRFGKPRWDPADRAAKAGRASCP